MKRKNISDVPPNLASHPHTYPQTLLKPLVLCGSSTPHATRPPPPTSLYFRLAGRRGYHVSKVNPNIENNPYKKSIKPNHIVSTYYVPSRDSSQMSLRGLSTSKVDIVLSHLSPQLQVSFTCSPPFFVCSQHLPCQQLLKNGSLEHCDGGSGSRLTMLVYLGPRDFLIGCRIFGVKSGRVLGKL